MIKPVFIVYLNYALIKKKSEINITIVLVIINEEASLIIKLSEHANHNWDTPPKIIFTLPHSYKEPDRTGQPHLLIT